MRKPEEMQVGERQAALPAAPRVAIVMLHWQGIDDTLACLESLEMMSYPNWDLVLVLNGADALEVQRVKARAPVSACIISLPENVGFARGCNLGAQVAMDELEAELVLFLNNDTVVDRNLLSKLVARAQDPRAGIVGAKTYDRGSRRLQFTVGELDLWRGRVSNRGSGEQDRGQFEDSRESDFVQGSCLLVRSSVLREIGLFDENFFAYWEETDLCLRARRQHFKVLYEPEAAVWHRGGAGTASPKRLYYLLRNNLYFMRKHGRWYYWPTFLLYFGLKTTPGLSARPFFHEPAATVRSVVRAYLDGSRMWPARETSRRPAPQVDKAVSLQVVHEDREATAIGVERDDLGRQLLVSFCNTRGLGAALGLFDVATGQLEVLYSCRDLERMLGMGGPWTRRRVLGITGLAQAGEYFFTAVQRAGEDPRLLVFDGALNPVGHHTVQGASDLHSLLELDGKLYAVSTGTDEVLTLELAGPNVASQSVYWRPDPSGPRADVHHLNGICRADERILVSGFGKKNSQLWSSAEGGFIYDVCRGETLASGIDHPHSVTVFGDEIAYCESRRRTLQVLGRARARGPQLPGYTRGLCRIGSHLLAGTSRSRRVSKSTGVRLEQGAAGREESRCSISRLSLETCEVEQTVDLSGFAQEIYDLLPCELGWKRWE